MADVTVAETPPPAPEPKKRGLFSSIWVKIALGVAAFIALIIAGLVALVAFFPKDAAVSQIERQVVRATERNFDIAGDFSFTIWPAIGFSAGDVTLSNPAGYDQATPFLSAKRVVFAVAFMPLVQERRIEVRRLHMEEPQLNLIARDDGRANWEFPTAEEEQPELQSLQLEDVRVTDGRLTFRGPVGAPMVVEDIDSTLSLASLDEAAQAQGTFRYLNQPLNFEATIATPRAMLTQGATPLNVTFNNAIVDGAFEGSLDTKTGAITGAANARGSSLRRVAAWFGSPLPEGPNFGRYEVRGQYAQDAQGIRLTRGAYKVDAIEATGDVMLRTLRDGRMHVSGALATQRLDLNPYLPAPAQAPAAAGSGAPAGGVNAAAAWPTTPLDLTGLRGMDADLRFSIASLSFQRMNFENAALHLGLTGGVADARLTQLSLYGGTGTARLVADGRQAVARIATELDVQNVQALPLLQAAINFDRIEGRGRLTSSFVGQGRSQAEIMRTLRGNATFAFNDGAVKGVNLAQVARQVQAALQRTTVGPSAQTDFAELAATFQITDGVAVTQDLRMLNPYVRLEGTGLIDIGQQSLNMRILPRAVRSAEGQGGQMMTGLGVPFRIYGPWARVQYRADVEDAIRSAVAEQAQRALQRSNLGDLGALFGIQRPASAAPATPAAAPATPSEAPAPDAAPATPAPAQPEAEKSTRDRARDALEGLFRRN